MADRRLAVLGSPIAHSKSPRLHTAAYRVLDLDWSYQAAEVRAGELGRFLGELDDSWRGLSLTMPLKREVLKHLDVRDVLVDEVGAANTVLIDDGTLTGFNTDVYGVERMLAEALPGGLRTVLVLGAGATACSVVAALARRSVEHVTAWTRSPDSAGDLESAAARVGMSVDVVSDVESLDHPDAVISTLPGTAELSADFPLAMRSRVPLVDIAYDPWPTAVARQWIQGDGAVVNNGMGMLIYQALVQVRIFVGGSPDVELPNEARVLGAMRAAAFGAR